MKELIPLVEKGFEVRDNIENNSIVYGISFEETNECLILTKPHRKDKEGFRTLANDDKDYFEKRKQILLSILTDSKNRGFSITTGIDAYEKFTQLPDNGLRFIRNLSFNNNKPLRPSPPNKDADLLVRWFNKEFQFNLKEYLSKSLKVTEKEKVQLRLMTLNELIEKRQNEFENKQGCPMDERIANTTFIQYLKREVEISNAVIASGNEQVFTAFNNDVNREVKYCETFKELYHYSVSQGLEMDEYKEMNLVAKENHIHLMHLLFNNWVSDKYQLERTEENYTALCNFENYKTFFKEYMKMGISKKRELENAVKKNRIEADLENEVSPVGVSSKQSSQSNKIKWLGKKEQFVELMMELTEKGFIEPFTHIDLKESVTSLFNAFDFSLSSKTPQSNTLDNLYQNFKEEKRSAIMGKPVANRKFDKIKPKTIKHKGLK
jgi:hypothetical protein